MAQTARALAVRGQDSVSAQGLFPILFHLSLPLTPSASGTVLPNKGIKGQGQIRIPWGPVPDNKKGLYSLQNNSGFWARCESLCCHGVGAVPRASQGPRKVCYVVQAFSCSKHLISAKWCRYHCPNAGR